MPTLCTALLYSGKKNPTWTLTTEQEDVFEDILKNAPILPQGPPPEPMQVLDYCGMFVRRYSDDGFPEDEMVIFDGVISMGGYLENCRQDKDSLLEKLLLETGHVSLPPAPKERMETAIHENLKAGPGKKHEALTLNVPRYFAGKWNVNLFTRNNNNCYNYANNLITDTFAQPGDGSGYNMNHIQTWAVRNAAISDGLEPVADTGTALTSGHYVALVIDNTPGDEDFHWYRKDASGYWSHKPGTGRAWDRDSSNNRIQDPRTCDRGNYDEFVGYFISIREDIRID